jgi:formyltetrahydrofolate deformylase
MDESQILSISCPDRPGLLAEISTAVARHGGNLLEVHQFTDLSLDWFFARFHFSLPDPAALERQLHMLGSQMRANWQMAPRGQRLRTSILVSHEPHCLQDILLRWKSGELNIDITQVIGNHEDCRDLTEREGLPFVHIPVQRDKTAAFENIGKQLQSGFTDLVILARFMQIIPPWLCQEYADRMINIHHSFLPAFIGAKPYHQAFERGVKVIGATCHYVTENLDEGPIIEQEVMRVEHYHSLHDLIRIGRDCEKLALSRGIRYHADRRIFVHNHKTIIFRD